MFIILLLFSLSVMMVITGICVMDGVFEREKHIKRGFNE